MLRILPDMQMLINAGIGTAVAMLFGFVDNSQLLMTFGAITAEEVLRKNVSPILANKLKPDNGLLDQTPMTVRQPSSATVRAGGNSSFFGGFPSGF
jgi:hypothetical protein